MQGSATLQAVLLVVMLMAALARWRMKPVPADSSNSVLGLTICSIVFLLVKAAIVAAVMRLPLPWRTVMVRVLWTASLVITGNE